MTVLFYTFFTIIFFMFLLVIIQYISEFLFFRTVCKMQNGKFVIMWLDDGRRLYLTSISKNGVSGHHAIIEDTLVFDTFNLAVKAIEECEVYNRLAIISLKG